MSPTPPPAQPLRRSPGSVAGHAADPVPPRAGHLSAVLWSAGDTLTRQGLQFVVAVLLARLLTPEDFGLVAMLYVFTGVAGVFIDSGLSAALIQRRHPTHQDESSVFFFNLAAALLVALVLALCAPLIADFFGHPILIPLSWAMALSMVVGSVGGVPAARLERALDFKTQMRITAASSLLSGCAAVALALAGGGVWSLAAQSLVAAAATSVLLWRSQGWRPGTDVSLCALRSLLGFGGFVLATRLLETLYTRAHALVIGKLFDAATLGLYNRGQATQQLPAGVVGGILNRVAFPLFARHRDDKARLAQGVGRSVRAIALVNAPLMLGLAVAAKPLVTTLFGDRWAGAAPILQVLCLAGILAPLEVINLSALAAQGHPGLILRTETIKKVAGTLVVVAAGFQGLLAIAWSQVLIGVLGFWLNARYSGILLGYSPLRQARDLLPYLALATLMALALWTLRQTVVLPAPLELALLTAAGIGFYLGGCALLRPAAFVDLHRALAERLGLAA